MAYTCIKKQEETKVSKTWSETKVIYTILPNKVTLRAQARLEI